MRHPRNLVYFVALAATGMLAPPLHAGKPLPQRPVTVTFRCTATVPDSVCPSDAVVSDGVRGDGAAYTAVLDSNGEMLLSLTSGAGRTLWLDFRNGPAETWPRDFDTLFYDQVIVHTNVVDATGATAPGGLTSIPVGSSSESRLKIAFNRLDSLGRTVQWGVRFNPEEYPGSDHVTARHTSTNIWEIEATSADRALLQSSVPRTRNSHGSDQVEGPFSMPFKIVVVLQ